MIWYVYLSLSLYIFFTYIWYMGHVNGILHMCIYSGGQMGNSPEWYICIICQFRHNTSIAFLHVSDHFQNLYFFYYRTLLDWHICYRCHPREWHMGYMPLTFDMYIYLSYTNMYIYGIHYAYHHNNPVSIIRCTPVSLYWIVAIVVLSYWLSAYWNIIYVMATMISARPR